MNKTAGTCTVGLAVLLHMAGLAVAQGIPDVDSSEQQPLTTDDLLAMSLDDLLTIEVASVSKTREKMVEAPMSVYVASNEELSRWGTRSLYESVQRIPGFSFYNTDFYGERGFISRGIYSIWRFGYTIELMPMLDYGHHLFPVDFFSSVEYARGPGGLAWGSNASAGFINANIKKLDGFELVGQYGMQNFTNLALMFGHTSGDRSLFVGYNFRQQDAERQQNASGGDYYMNGTRPSHNALVKIDYKPVKFTMMYELSDHDAPDAWFGSMKYDADSARWLEMPASDLWDTIEARSGQNPHDNLQAVSLRGEITMPSFSDHFNWYAYYDYCTRQWWMQYVAEVQDRKRAVGVGADMFFLGDNLHINLGGDIWGRFEHNSPSMTTNTNEFINSQWFDDATMDNRIDYNNVYAQVTGTLLRQFKVVVGGRLDYQRGEQTPALLTGPRLALIWAPSYADVVVKYLFNRAPRRPQTNEIMLTTPEPEVLTSNELNLSFAPLKSLTFDVTAFHQKLEDQITMVPGTFDDFINAGGSTTMGIEWAIKYRPINPVLIYTNGSYVHARTESERYYNPEDGVTYDVSVPSNNNDEPLFVPALTGFGGVEYAIAGTVWLNLAVRGVARVPYVAADGTYHSTTTAFVDLGLRTRRFFGERVEFSVGALNLFDNRKQVPAFGEHTSMSPGTMQPEGLRVNGGLRLFFKT